jgi:5,10-methylenetetrahydrofolate reductase
MLLSQNFSFVQFSQKPHQLADILQSLKSLQNQEVKAGAKGASDACTNANNSGYGFIIRNPITNIAKEISTCVYTKC